MQGGYLSSPLFSWCSNLIALREQVSLLEAAHPRPCPSSRWFKPSLPLNSCWRQLQLGGTRLKLSRPLPPLSPTAGSAHWAPTGARVHNGPTPAQHPIASPRESDASSGGPGLPGCAG